jgi:RNA polymerase sporulation-specific sigma factor
MSGLLPQEEVERLIELAHKGDKEAQETLVKGNIALVKSIVAKFIGRGAEFDDLYQVGCMGLVKAINHFDSAFNVRFSTYAVPMIAGEIKRYLRDDGAVKVSRSLKELASRSATAAEALKAKLGREPSIEEVAKAVGESPEDVAMARDASRACVSLHEPMFEDDSALLIDHVSTGDREDELIDRLLLKELLDTLDPRERQIIFLRYFKDETQSEIAKKLGVSQVQISRLESKIIRKLREKAI